MKIFMTYSPCRAWTISTANFTHLFVCTNPDVMMSGSNILCWYTFFLQQTPARIICYWVVAANRSAFSLVKKSQFGCQIFDCDIDACLLKHLCKALPFWLLLTNCRSFACVTISFTCTHENIGCPKQVSRSKLEKLSQICNLQNVACNMWSM